jgi:hypothetical protein
MGGGYGKQDSLVSMRANDKQDKRQQIQSITDSITFHRLERLEEETQFLKRANESLTKKVEYSAIAMESMYDKLNKVSVANCVRTRVEYHVRKGGLDPPREDPQAPDGKYGAIRELSS